MISNTYTKNVSSLSLSEVIKIIHVSLYRIVDLALYFSNMSGRLFTGSKCHYNLTWLSHCVPPDIRSPIPWWSYGQTNGSISCDANKKVLLCGVFFNNHSMWWPEVLNHEGAPRCWHITWFDDQMIGGRWVAASIFSHVLVIWDPGLMKFQIYLIATQ